jgi:uncharacterized membrane protein YoaK (UPF0700 family)
MFLHRLSHNAKLENVFHWFVMALSAGAVNAGGFLSTGRFVTHVTGFGTLFGAEIGRLHWEGAFGILSVPLYFLLGAFVAGWCIDRQILKSKPPHFDWVMVLSATCLVTASLIPDFEASARFGEMIHLRGAYVLLALLCFSSGLQNAALTSSSGSSVRTTHLTGITTDLGLGLARLLYEPLHPLQMKDEVRTAWIRVGTIAAFILGSALGAGLYLKYGMRSFLFPAILSSYAAFHGRKAKIHAHRPTVITP